jgi:hypothetical protein
MRRRCGRPPAAVLAAILAVATWPTPGAQAAPPPPKPDLVVTGELQGGGDNVLIGRGAGRFTWHHQTRNAGAALAGASTTAVGFVMGSGRTVFPVAGRLAVPRLLPRRSHAGRGSFRMRFPEFGTFPTRICADFAHVVAEGGNEGNNCQQQGPITVVPRELSGRVTGKTALWPGGSVKLTWAATVSYFLTQVIHSGVVGADYAFADARVNFKVQGTDPNGCVWTGPGTYEPPAQGIRLQFGRLHRYTAENFVSSNFHFVVTRTCDALPAQIDFFPASQLVTKWLDTDGWRQFQDPGLEALRGTFIDNVTSSHPITYTWNLAAT